MFHGEKINLTEGRAVLHTALRAPRGSSAGNRWARHQRRRARRAATRIGQFAERVRSGAWLGYSGQRITDIVNIGIGGSDLGPGRWCARALRSLCAHPRLNLRISRSPTLDGHDLDAALAARN